ncbi:MAG TPA: LysM peptidoglycan-binding domain-containing protein [Trebonia sp.]|jgi:LysM repeat protein|nr:LysM peptidoglycan-binding domain-containing protein [Trebonia sp.]
MGSGRNDRRLRIRRRGRHTTPSQVEKVAEVAGKAAPAMAIAGALVAVPQVQHAVAGPAAVAAAHVNHSADAQERGTQASLESVASHSITAADMAVNSLRGTAVTTAKTVAKTTAKTAATSYYTVHAGDTLSQIAGKYYHNAGDWPWLYHVNDAAIKDPNLIYTGQVLRIPADPPSSAVVDSYIPRHAKTAATVSTPAVTSSATSSSATSSSATGDDSGSGTQTVTQSASQGSGGSSGSSSSGSGSSSGGGSGTPGGTLSCSGLEQLWEEAGGNPADAFMAAEIAMAESGGNQYALSPTDDYGYWQINASNGALATFNAFGNARAAITLSQDGTNWDPWTTYTSGAYEGRC